MALVIDYSSGIFEAAPSGETVGTVTGNATLDLTSGNLFNHTPTANTTFVFSNPPTTGSAYDMTLKVVGANVATGYDLANASYDSVSFDVSSQDGSPFDIQFKTDGTKFYIAGSTNDAIFQYSFSTAWDISTASYDSVSFSFSSQTTNPTALFFKPDGTEMFILGGFSFASVYKYTLSTAWDILTASYSSVSFSVSSQDTSPFGIDFKYDDGLKMYIAGATSDTIYQYSTSSSSTALATITWPSSVKWAEGITPPAPANGEKDVYNFFTLDGGTTYYGFQAGDAMA